MRFWIENIENGFLLEKNNNGKFFYYKNLTEVSIEITTCISDYEDTLKRVEEN